MIRQAQAVQGQFRLGIETRVVNLAIGLVADPAE